MRNWTVLIKLLLTNVLSSHVNANGVGECLGQHDKEVANLVYDKVDVNKKENVIPNVHNSDMNGLLLDEKNKALLNKAFPVSKVGVEGLLHVNDKTKILNGEDGLPSAKIAVSKDVVEGMLHGNNETKLLNGEDGLPCVNIALNYLEGNTCGKKYRFQRHLTRKPKTPRTPKKRIRVKKKKTRSTKLFDLGGTFDMDEFERYINEDSNDRKEERKRLREMGAVVSDSYEDESNSSNSKTKNHNDTVSESIQVHGTLPKGLRDTTEKAGKLGESAIDLTSEYDEDDYCISDPYKKTNKPKKETRVKPKNAEKGPQFQNKLKTTRKTLRDKNVGKEVTHKTQTQKELHVEPKYKESAKKTTNPVDKKQTKEVTPKNDPSEPKHRVKRFAKKKKKKGGGGGGGRGGFDFGDIFGKQKNTNNKYKGGKKGGGGGGKGKKKGGGGKGGGSESGMYMDLGDIFEMNGGDDSDDDEEYYEVDSESEFSHRGGRGRGGNQYNKKKNKKQNKNQKNNYQNQQQGDGIVREAMKLTEVKDNDSIFKKRNVKIVSNKNGVKTEREENTSEEVIKRLEHLKSNTNDTQKRAKRSAVKPKKKSKDPKRPGKGAAKKKAAKAKKAKPRVRKKSSEEISREKLKITEIRSNEEDALKTEKGDAQTKEDSTQSENSDEDKNEADNTSETNSKQSETNSKESNRVPDDQSSQNDYSDNEAATHKIDLNEALGVDMNRLKQKYQVDSEELRQHVMEAKDYIEEKKKAKKKGKKDSFEEAEKKKKKKKRTTVRRGHVRRRPPTKHTTKKRREKKKVFDYSIEYGDKNKFVKRGIKEIIRELNVSTRCDYCGSGKASIQHVLAGCKMALYFGFYSRRHDRVLQMIRDAFQQAVDQANRTSGIPPTLLSSHNEISDENQTVVDTLFLYRLRYILTQQLDLGNVTKKRGRKAKTTPGICPLNGSHIEGHNCSVCQPSEVDEDGMGAKLGVPNIDVEGEVEKSGEGHRNEVGDSEDEEDASHDEGQVHKDVEEGHRSKEVDSDEEGGSGEVEEENGSRRRSLESEEDVGADLEDELEGDEEMVTRPMKPLDKKGHDMEEIPEERKKPRRLSSYEFNQNIEQHPSVFIEGNFSRDNPLHPYISNNKIQPILSLANDWKLYSDNRKSRYSFPIPELQKNNSLLKPDLLLLSPSLKYILILELTIPWDFNMARQSISKAKKYKSLIRALNAKQYNVHFFTIEVGLTGRVGSDLEVLFHNIGLDRATRQRYLANITNTTLESSHSIWHRKRERKWKFWVFWKKRNQEKYKKKHRKSKSKGVAVR